MVATYHQPPELLDSLVVKKVLRRLDCIVVVSPEQASYFREFLEPDKIRLILHGINIDYFKPGNTRKEQGKFKCITVGNWLRDFKVLRNVAKRLSNYRQIEFLIVSSPRPELEGLKNVKLYSHIDDAQLRRLYQQSDILFMPLLNSTANNSILEGIACGLPVVSTLLPSVKMYLPGEEASLIKHNDPQRFAEVIVHLAHDPVARRKMARLARKRAEELDWHNITPNFETLYSELKSNSAPRKN